MTERTPVTLNANQLLEEFKLHIRMTSNDLDADLRQKLMAAVRSAEHHIGQIILQSEFETTVKFSRVFPLKAPVVSVQSLEVDGSEVADYTVNGRDLIIGQDVTGERMTVKYVAGANHIDYDIKAAIFMHAATLFNNPTDRPEERDRTTARNLLRPYRTWGEH